MMLFGDLKSGGWLTVTVVDGKILLVPKPKLAKVPLIEAPSLSDLYVFGSSDAD